jgi:hypothetical protein
MIGRDRESCKNVGCGNAARDKCFLIFSARHKKVQTRLKRRPREAYSDVLHVLPVLSTGDTIVDNASSTAKVGALLLQERSESMTHG